MCVCLCVCISIYLYVYIKESYLLGWRHGKVHGNYVYSHMYVQLGCLCESVVSLTMEMILGQNCIAKLITLFTSIHIAITLETSLVCVGYHGN